MGGGRGHVTCCVTSCKNNGKNNKSVRFYSFPTAFHRLQQRQLWLAAIKKTNADGTPWQPKVFHKICSAHFIGNAKSENQYSPSYAPTIFPDGTRKINESQALNRFNRFMKRRTKSMENKNINSINNYKTESMDVKEINNHHSSDVQYSFVLEEQRKNNQEIKNDLLEYKPHEIFIKGEPEAFDETQTDNESKDNLQCDTITNADELKSEFVDEIVKEEPEDTYEEVDLKSQLDDYALDEPENKTTRDTGRYNCVLEMSYEQEEKRLKQLWQTDMSDEEDNVSLLDAASDECTSSSDEEGSDEEIEDTSSLKYIKLSDNDNTKNSTNSVKVSGSNLSSETDSVMETIERVIRDNVSLLDAASDECTSSSDEEGSDEEIEDTCSRKYIKLLSDNDNTKNTSKSARVSGSNLSSETDPVMETIVIRESVDIDEENLVWNSVTGSNLKTFSFTEHNAGVCTHLYKDYLNKTPYDFFELVVNEDIINMMVTETNRYASQSKVKESAPRARIHDWYDTNVTEMKQFIGVIFWMGLCQYPNIESYWSKNIIYENSIKSVMSRNRFQLMLNMWHFSDNNNLSNDRLQKITPLLDKLFK